MVQVLKQSVVVGPGGHVELQSDQLPEGRRVEVVVWLPEDGQDTPLSDMIGAARGVFPTPEAVDEFIRELRDEWDH